MARQTSTKFASHFDTLMRYYVVNYRDASPQLILRYAHRSPNFGKTTQGTQIKTGTKTMRKKAILLIFP